MIVLVAKVAVAATACPSLEQGPDCDGSLTEVLATTLPGDTVELAGGTYQGSWLIEHSLTLRPRSADDPVLLTGDLGPALHVLGGDLVLEDLTVVSNNNHAVRLAAGSNLLGTGVRLRASNQLMPRGGVLWMEGGDLTLIDSGVSGGQAVTDGGLISVTGDVSLTEVTLRDGESGDRGGLIFVDGRLDMTDTLLEQGRSGAGGGLFTTGGGRFEGVTLRDCVAVDGGGGVLDGTERTEVLASRVLHNRATGVGGGLNGFYMGIEGSDICGNQAAVGGRVAAGWFFGRHNVFTRNTATDQYGALFVTAEGFDLVNVEYSHFVANTAPSTPAFRAFGQALHNLIADNVGGPNESVFDANSGLGNTLVWNNTGRIPEVSGLIEGDPQLAPWTDCSSELLPGWYGAARDAGPEDQTDPDGSRADVGAYALGGRDNDLWTDLDRDGVFALYDCAPRDDTIFAGAEDTPYDDIDQDCRGDDDFDADDDGHLPVEYGGEDCDDNDPTAYPGAPEDPRDNIDNDCDGWVGSTTRIVLGGCAVGATGGPSWIGLLRRR